MEFVDFSGHGAYQDAADVGEASAHLTQHFNHSATSLHDQTKGAYYNPNISHNMSCDIKPRLTKEQADLLEAHFNMQNKPSTSTKKGFAETLNVSLDKVNNWFQNRRAKSKQDAKKQAGQLNLYQTHSQGFASDSDSSPFVTSPDYAATMSGWSTENQNSNGLGISQVQQSQEQGQIGGLSNGSSTATNDQFTQFQWPQQMSQDAFDSPQEVNRRTLTQEQFDELTRNEGMINGSSGFDDFDSFNDPDMLEQVFGQMQGNDFKQQHANAFPHPAGAPLSSNDSTVPSTISDMSYGFPSSNIMQNQANLSASSSEWGDSRSSSLSAQHDGQWPQMAAVQQPPSASTSQWQPGSSVPVDLTAQMKEFQRVQAAAQARSSPQQPQTSEQPLAWPADEAYMRRDSSASLLAQSMKSVGIQTPVQEQNATFKSPAPPTSIAARRQRPRPAALGLASLRSQSYGGAGQPGSPGHSHQRPGLNTAQPLRRIRSSNVVDGGVAQGRVMKSMPGSAQRSPLHFSFSDAANSPSLVRNMSHGNLAPPTPMSPSEFPRQEQQRQVPTWQSSSAHASRQPSISETDLEHGAPYQPSASVPAQNFTSPPHTPLYYQQQFVQQQQQRIGNHVITENTPPQSAPASQSCFPSNIWGLPHQHAQHHHYSHMQPQPPPQFQQPMQAMPPPQTQQYMNVAVPEQQYQTPNVPFAPHQQANVAASGPAPGIPLQFANGVPIVDDHGNMVMAFPPQLQMVQQQHAHAQAQAQAQAHAQSQSHPMQQTPSQMAYSFVTSAGSSPASLASALPPKPAPELFVHEYSPPDHVKRSATPRKTVDSGPKNYSFNHSTPENFEEKKGKKTDSKENTASPASSSGTASTS